jgi:predicted lipase
LQRPQPAKRKPKKLSAFNPLVDLIENQTPDTSKRIVQGSVPASTRHMPDWRETENYSQEVPVTPVIPVFDRKFALAILVAAEAAYDLKKLPSGWEIAGLIEPDDFGYVATKGDDVLISFRGTENEREWLEDGDGLLVPNLYGQGQVHQGFQIQYTALRKSLLSLMRWRPAGKLLITGHSLGAALAILAASDLVQQSQCSPRVYTFAGPRVGPASFSTWFDARIPDCFRTCNLWDLVTHLPSRIFGYSHVGHGVLVDGGFTADLHVAHNMEKSYRPGLENLLSLPITVAKVS